MKIFVLLLVLIVYCWAIPTKLELTSPHWVNFKTLHSKEYNDENEEYHRFNIFHSNLKDIEYHNRLYEEGLVTYKKGINHFGDLTSEEFMNHVVKYNLAKKRKNLKLSIDTYDKIEKDLPKSVDWRTKNAVTPIKNQGHCGSCWSFSATGALEGQYALKTGKLENFSEQNLLDCSYIYGNIGCEGGLMDQAFQYIKENGIETEKNYPYTAKEDKCKFSEKKSVTKIQNYLDVANGNESALQSAIAKFGPISVAIEVTSNFQFYYEGVFNDYQCNENLNHGVLAVGFDGEENNEHYIVKNSWGTTWGENGYIKMARNKNNNCGIASMASFPIL